MTVRIYPDLNFEIECMLARVTFENKTKEKKKFIFGLDFKLNAYIYIAYENYELL
jgi:hypothetical protein